MSSIYSRIDALIGRAMTPLSRGKNGNTEDLMEIVKIAQGSNEAAGLKAKTQRLIQCQKELVGYARIDPIKDLKQLAIAYATNETLVRDVRFDAFTKICERYVAKMKGVKHHDARERISSMRHPRIHYRQQSPRSLN